MTEIEERAIRSDRTTTGRHEEYEEILFETLRLGHDIRFVLAVVGGGAARVGREVAGRHLRYLETVAINCDPRVQSMEEFDRRVYLGPASGTESDSGGSSAVGGQRARAAEPALERLFDGATFVTVVASLGGGTGTGVLPFVLEAAARSAEVLSVFLIKPFSCEGDRRALAERAIGRLHFIEPLVDRQQRGLANVQVLDNEAFARDGRHVPFARLNAHFAEIVADHIEKAFVIPAEVAVEAGRIAWLAEMEPVVRVSTSAHPADPEPLPPLAGPPTLEPPPMLGGVSPDRTADIELTFEVVDAPPGPAPPS